LDNFRGVEAEDGSSSWNTPIPAGLPSGGRSASRKRQRQETAASEQDNGNDQASTSRYPYDQSQDGTAQTQSTHYPGQQQEQSVSQHQLPQSSDRPEGPSHPYLDEASYLQDMTSSHDTSLPRDHGAKQRVLYHPFTSRIRATARDIPPEEMFSTDEDETAKQREQSRSRRAGSTGLDSSEHPLDNRALDDNAPHSPPLSSHRGFVFESSNPTASSSSTSMRRTGSASSAPAALGPTTAKISSSNASDFRVDKKGNLRYLGSASTSAVVAELADRQRWDVESPAMISNAQNAAAAARRRSSVRLGSVNGGIHTNGDIASSSASSLTAVDELDDSPPEATSAVLPPPSREFARPTMRPKPWEIFSNLGVTVAGALPPVDEIALPPEDLARKLLDAFFEQIHPL